MDDLDDLLTPGPVPPESPVLHATIEQGVRPVLSRRRMFVRVRRVALLAACYAAGLASMWLWSQVLRAPRTEVVQRVEPIPESHPPAPKPPSPEPNSEVDPYRNDPPDRLERWAFISSGEKRVDLYRRAGDGFLERNDVVGALRCYRRALDGATATDLAIQADKDSWLLMSLKMSRQKERPDARVN
jgi:hypothetical protein